jgi:hypothetical protein
MYVTRVVNDMISELCLVIEFHMNQYVCLRHTNPASYTITSNLMIFKAIHNILGSYLFKKITIYVSCSDCFN